MEGEAAGKSTIAGLVRGVPLASAPASIARFARRKPLGFIGAIIVTGFVVLAVFAPIISPYDPEQTDLRRTLEPSSWDHLFGTDRSGKDILSRLIWGSRLSMTVGFGAIAISGVVGTALALIVVYTGRWTDMIVGRAVDAMIAMPALMILITILGVARRTDANLILAMVVALGVLRIAPLTRVYRSAVLEIRNRQFVEAAETTGAGPIRVMLRHILPNIMPLIIVTSTIALPAMILAEASLSFLGFGPSGETSWGQMLATDGRQYFRQQPGLVVYPGIAIFLAVFGFNILGDALRDVLDPRLRGSEER